MPSAETTREFDIRAYGAILWRRKLIVVATLILVVGGAYMNANSKTRLYAASGEMLFTQRSTAAAISALSQDTSNDPQRNLATDVRLIQSSEVAKVARTFYRNAGPIQATAATDANIIQLTSVSPDPQNTERTVTAYMRAFVDYRRTSALDDVIAAQQVLQKRIDHLSAQIAAIDAAAPKASISDRTTLLSQRASYSGQQDLARQQIDRLQESVNFDETTRILAKPGVPTVPFSPKPKKSATQAAGIGLVLGIGLAFLRDFLDDSIKTRESLTAAAPNVSVLGVIPTVASPKLAVGELVSVTRPDSSASEAYRSLRTSIQFMGLDRPLHTVQVTSPVASEGKTTTVANLAVAFASIGQRVVVVCCDLRRPRLHELFGLSNNVGFTSVLLGEVSLSAALQPVKGVNGLLVLASGKPPPNPAELLAGARAKELFAALAEHSDIVLVDSPPVLPVTDAAVIANRVDGTILVASATSSQRKRFRHALQALDQVDSRVIGTVLNDAPRGVAGYGYGYGYGYGETGDESHQRPPSTNGAGASPKVKPKPMARQGRRRR